MGWMKRISQNEDRVLDVRTSDVARARKTPRALVVGVFAACTAMALPVLAQLVMPHTVYLWDGSGGAQSNVKVGAWGNGDYEVKKDVEGRGQNTLEVRTRNFYEGARFSFARPLALDNYRQSGLLRLRIRSEKATKLNVLPNGSAIPGSPTQSPNPNDSSNFNPYMPQAGNAIANPYAPPGRFGAPGSTPVATPPVISTIQVMMRLQNGALFGQFAFSDVNPRPDERGWQTFVVPLSQMRATPDASGGLRTVIISGDREGTFDLGQVALVPNSSSNSYSIRRATDPVGTQQTQIEVAPGSLTLVADVESGATDVIVDWNFDADKTGALPDPPFDVLPNSASQPGMAPGMPFGRPPFGANPYVPPSGGPPFSSRPGGPRGARPSGSPSFNSRPGGPRGARPSGSPSSSSPSATLILGDRLDARGLKVVANFPNEEQDYRVEATIKDSANLREIGKASVIIKVRSPE